jgi:hypothetical protein
MSKSYKYPVFKSNTNQMKKIANRCIRKKLKRLLTCRKGNWYRKLFNPYNICDWKIYPKTKNQKIIAKRK